MLLRKLRLFIIEPVLDLSLILYNSSCILRLRYRRLPGYGNALLGIVVPFEFGDTSCNGSLLACRKLVLAALAARCSGGALLVLGIDGNFRRVVAGVDHIRPSWRDGSRRIGEDLDVWHR